MERVKSRLSGRCNDPLRSTCDPRKSETVQSALLDGDLHRKWSRLVRCGIGGLGDLRVNELFPSRSSSKTHGDRPRQGCVPVCWAEFGCNAAGAKPATEFAKAACRGFVRVATTGQVPGRSWTGQGVEQICAFAYAQATGSN